MELNGLSLEQDSVATGLSITTCFHMCHKLYQAISKVNNNVILRSQIELAQMDSVTFQPSQTPKSLHIPKDLLTSDI